MNAVANKPRAKAKPKAAKSDLQVRLDEIFAKLRDGQEKLQLALESAELTHGGESSELLLRAVVEGMLPAAIAPIFRQPLTRDDAEAAYSGMFGPLAAIDGTIALARGQVIESTLREARVVLDEANCQMDLANEFKLPEGVAKGTAAAEGTTREVADSAPASPIISASGPATFRRAVLLKCSGRVNQAVALIDVCAEHYKSHACWGASRLLDMAAVCIARAITDKDGEEAPEGSAILSEALAMMQMIFDTEENIAVGGIISIVQIAKDELDGMLAVSEAARMRVPA